MDLSLETGSGTRASFDSRIDIEGPLTTRERTILLNSARHCDVHKVLQGHVAMNSEIVER
jgi:hypothetical protein